MLRGLISSERVCGRGEAAALGSHIFLPGGEGGTDAACPQQPGRRPRGRGSEGECERGSALPQCCPRPPPHSPFAGGPEPRSPAAALKAWGPQPGSLWEGGVSLLDPLFWQPGTREAVRHGPGGCCSAKPQGAAPPWPLARQHGWHQSQPCPKRLLAPGAGRPPPQASSRHPVPCLLEGQGHRGMAGFGMLSVVTGHGSA